MEFVTKKIINIICSQISITTLSLLTEIEFNSLIEIEISSIFLNMEEEKANGKSTRVESIITKKGPKNIKPRHIARLNENSKRFLSVITNQFISEIINFRRSLESENITIADDNYNTELINYIKYNAEFCISPFLIHLYLLNIKIIEELPECKDINDELSSLINNPHDLDLISKIIIILVFNISENICARIYSKLLIAKFNNINIQTTEMISYEKILEILIIKNYDIDDDFKISDETFKALILKYKEIKNSSETKSKKRAPKRAPKSNPKLGQSSSTNSTSKVIKRSTKSPNTNSNNTPEQPSNPSSQKIIRKPSNETIRSNGSRGSEDHEYFEEVEVEVEVEVGDGENEDFE